MTRTAAIHRNGPASWLVVFGFANGAEFTPANSKPSRAYKSERAALRAAAAWKA